MRRGSLKSARSDSNSSKELNSNQEELGSSLGLKHKWRKCECCQNKRQHDYLRELRQIRQRVTLINRMKEREEQEKIRREEIQLQLLRRDNMEQSFVLENRPERIESEYLIVETEKTESLDKSVEQPSMYYQKIEYPLPSSPVKNQAPSAPSYKQSLQYIKSQLSSIIEVSNSSSVVNDFKEEKKAPKFELSISVNYLQSKYTRSWTSKQQVINTIEELSKILY